VTGSAIAQRIAEKTGIPLPWMIAVMAHESGGSASAVRFEPHLFLKQRPELVQVLGGEHATHEGRLDAWSHNRIPYTHGEEHAASDVAEETDRAAHDRAFILDPRATMRSSSYGLFQVLGGVFIDSHPPLFKTPEVALATFDRDPLATSEALEVTYLLGRPALIAAAKRGDVRAWCSGYNGCKLERDPNGNVIGDGGCARYAGRFRKHLATAGWPVTG
jgi:hypothetical protein